MKDNPISKIGQFKLYLKDEIEKRINEFEDFSEKERRTKDENRF